MKLNPFACSWMHHAVLLACFLMTISRVTAQLTADEWRQIDPLLPLLDKDGINLNRLKAYHMKIEEGKRTLGSEEEKPKFRALLNRLRLRLKKDIGNEAELSPEAFHVQCVTKLEAMDKKLKDPEYKTPYMDGAKADMPAQYYETVFLWYSRMISDESDILWKAYNLPSEKFRPQTMKNLLEIPREVGLKINPSLLTTYNEHNGWFAVYPDLFDLFESILNDDRLKISQEDMKKMTWFWGLRLSVLRILAKHPLFDWEHAESLIKKGKCPGIVALLRENGRDPAHNEFLRAQENLRQRIEKERTLE